MNEGDESRAEVAMDAPEPIEEMPQIAGGAGVAAQHSVEAAPRRRSRGQGRRATLVRNGGGGYSIWMMSRHIQSFCNEWEDVTNFQLPEGIEQQVFINVDVAGEARPVRPEYSGQDQSAPDAPEVAREEVLGNQLRRAVARHDDREREDQGPRINNDLIRMFQELPEHNQEIIAHQIRANHVESHGAALRSIAHPGNPSMFADVLGELRASVRHTLEVLERLG